jgi:hypothetical protein
MPAWVHDRAQHLLAKNPNMPKSMAFALATDQGHATGKTPKKYGTSEGRKRAKQKYDKPRKEYVKTPNPGNLETPKLESRKKTAMYGPMAEELLKIAADVLSGGKADDKTNSDFSAKQMAMGKKVEMEHTNSPELAKEISRDHLEEFPDYYTRLHKMEAEAEKAKEKTASWGAMTSALAKLANGDEDEDEDEDGGEESGRAPTPEDKDAIRKFLAARPQGMEDEEYHEFLEARGVKVPLGEAYAYDLAKKGINKSASGCVVDFDNDGNRMGVEWHEDALARIMGLPRTSGPIMGKTGAARWMKELGDPAVLRGMKDRLKSVVSRTHGGSNYGDYVKEQGSKTLDTLASRGKGGTGPAGGSLTRGLRKQLNPDAIASNKGSIDDLVNANAAAQQVSKRKRWMQPKEFRNQKTSSIKLSAMKEAFKRSYYHGTGPWGPTFMKTDKMPDPSRVAQSQMPAQQAIENMSGKVAGAAITPAARLATSMQVGRPPAALSKVGPSVAQVGKIKGPGSGTALPGAKEGGSV